jgi:hypothetical protein
MPFGAYFDESERLEFGDPCCVAGFIFKDKSYVWFAKRWKRILTGARPGGIEAMHLKDLVAGKREFHGLPIAQRQRVLGECVALLKEAATGVAGAIVDQTEFEEVAGPDWPRRFGSIYTFLCLRAAQLAGYWLKAKKNQHEPVV